MRFEDVLRLGFGATLCECLSVEKPCCSAVPWNSLAKELRAVFCLVTRLSMGISILALPGENYFEKCC